MTIKSTQIMPVEITVGEATVKGSYRVIKYLHRKYDPDSQGIPQREAVVMDEAGNRVLRIKKFFRHMLVECGDSFETTDILMRLTPSNVERLAKLILALSGDDKYLVRATIAYIQRFHRPNPRGQAGL